MNRLISFFSRPLPQNDQGNWLQAGLIAGAIVFFLLFFLRPFGLGQFEGNIFFVAFCFSMLSVAVTWCYGECVFKPWVRRVKTWRVWHECAAILLLFCCVSLGNSILSFLWFHNPVSLQLFLAFPSRSPSWPWNISGGCAHVWLNCCLRTPTRKPKRR